MKRYIAVIELDDDEEIVGDANISYTYRSNGTNYGTDESVELKTDAEEQCAIQINDFDTPIEVAQKIINATTEVEASMVDKAMMRAFGGKEVDTIHRDMFSIAEIEEIAGYLMVYCNTHKPKESDE
jgi:hypothetical protein